MVRSSARGLDHAENENGNGTALLKDGVTGASDEAGGGVVGAADGAAGFLDRNSESEIGVSLSFGGVSANEREERNERDSKRLSAGVRQGKGRQR